MKAACLLFLTLFSSSSFAEVQSREGIDYIKELIVMMGTIDQMDRETHDTFRQLRARDPKNGKYYQCLEDNYSANAVIDKLRPHYKKIFTDQILQEWYEMLITDTGKKVVQLIKTGPPFDNARAKLSPKEAQEIEAFYNRSLIKIINPQTNIAIQQAVKNGAQELFTEMRARCQTLAPSL